ncbi:MAG TPA: DUF4468 domain-containing protein [Bacteroidia bacterium]|nr:DUF4468 domain-containing protein [Bacteroidia bacterium]
MLICFLFIVSIKTANTQDNVFYEDVLTTENKSLSQSQVFTKASEWLVYSFYSTKNPVFFSNEKTGRIIGNGSFQVSIPQGVNGNTTPMGHVSFVISIFCKDGKSRLVFSSVTHDAEASGFGSGGNLLSIHPVSDSLGLSDKNWKKIQEETTKSFKGISQALLAYLNATEKDW